MSKPPPRTPLAMLPPLPVKGAATMPEAIPGAEPPAPAAHAPPGPAVVALRPGPVAVPSPFPAAVAHPPEKEGTLSMNLRLPTSLQRKLKKQAYETGVPATQIILTALRAYLPPDEP